MHRLLTAVFPLSIPLVLAACSSGASGDAVASRDDCSSWANSGREPSLARRQFAFALFFSLASPAATAAVTFGGTAAQA
jgi:hypothetical protein